MARRGSRVLGETPGQPSDDRREWRSSAKRPEPLEEIWILEPEPPGESGLAGESGEEARRLPGRAAPPSSSGAAAQARPTRGGSAAALPSDVLAELASAVGRQRAPRLAERLADAARAYEHDRYQEALRITRSLVQQAPDAAAARELHGLVCYRLGRWRDAISHLTAAAELGGDDPSQLPVVMDCHRALGHHRRVTELWEALRSSSPPADLLVEGRLVMAEDLAEQGRLDDAVALLINAGAERDLRRPSDRHIRQWYVLGDLLERAGDVPRARRLFERVADADPGLADAAQRAAALGAPASSGPHRGERGSHVTLGEVARRSEARRTRR